MSLSTTASLRRLTMLISFVCNTVDNYYICNMEKRNKKGQFVKGESYSPNTQFKPGQHWREKKPYWDKEWLSDEYVNKFRSANDIALQFGVTESAILFWLRKHKIKCRDVSEIRSRKYWGEYKHWRRYWNFRRR